MELYKFKIKRGSKPPKLKIFLTQDLYNMGVFEDVDFIPSSIVDTTDYADPDIRPNGATANDWFVVGGRVNGTTDSKLTYFKTYDFDEPYKLGVNIDSGLYFNYNNSIINGITRVTRLIGNIQYTFDANDDATIGTEAQSAGILYEDTPISTQFSFNSEGYNAVNNELKALIKEEYLLGVVEQPTVSSDVFIDRGVDKILEKHLRFTESKTIQQLARYGNGYFNIV